MAQLTWTLYPRRVAAKHREDLSTDQRCSSAGWRSTSWWTFVAGNVAWRKERTKPYHCRWGWWEICWSAPQFPTWRGTRPLHHLAFDPRTKMTAKMSTSSNRATYSLRESRTLVSLSFTLSSGRYLLRKKKKRELRRSTNPRLLRACDVKLARQLNIHTNFR